MTVDAKKGERPSTLPQHAGTMNVSPSTALFLTTQFSLDDHSIPPSQPVMNGHNRRASWDGQIPSTNIPFPRDSLPHSYSPSHSKRLPRWGRRPSLYLVLYFSLSLALTLYNKSILISFPFPYTLSAVHALCTSVGCSILLRTRSSPAPRLNQRETLALVAFSILYTVNIAVSNVSLGLVTLPFHQVVRASTPFFTIVFSAIILRVQSTRIKLVSLLPVVAGVGFATYGDYYYTPWGFCLTVLGTILASLKTIFTNVLQKPALPAYNKESSLMPGSDARHHDHSPSIYRVALPSLSPLHLLYLLSPLAFIQTAFIAYFSGEFARACHHVSARPYPSSAGAVFIPGLLSTIGVANYSVALLLINGIMAFALNVVSFSANKKIGAVSMTVAANVKQVLTILCAVILFDLTITPMNGFGIVLTLVGGAIYAWVELKERQSG